MAMDRQRSQETLFHMIAEPVFFFFMNVEHVLSYDRRVYCMVND